VTPLFLFLALNGCRRNVGDSRPVIVSDEWWANDYAAEGASRSCSPEQRSWCEDKARDEEKEFWEATKTAFASDRACSGIRLVAAYGSERVSDSEESALRKVYDGPYWALQVNFSPSFEGTTDKQSWQLTTSDFKSRTSGESSAASLVRTVCDIVKGNGGALQ
jgi:hypothetical protein